jgi:hypothetical protein
MKSKHSVIKAALHGVALGVALSGASSAHAFQFDTGIPDLTVRWDNTFKYSNAFRLRTPSASITGDPNLDDGDRNFHRGLISNRVDWLTELDVSTPSFGVRVSAAAWYDTVYNHSNANDSPATVNSVGIPHNQFTSDTRVQSGKDLQLMDAFVYGKKTIGGVPVAVRLGQHALVYGETLFFGANGIANAQGPIDFIKLLTVPGTEFKELLLPVPQLSGSVQITPHLSIGGYYQFEWRKDMLPPVGSYLSNIDFFGDGSQRLFAGGPLVPGGSPAAFFRGPDMRPKNGGQGGLQLHYTPPGTDFDIGLYAAQYADKTPQIYLKPTAANASTGQIGQFMFVYPENIQTFGASLSTNVGSANVAGELSVRMNTPLVSGAQVITPGVAADNNRNPLYAVGNSLHANISSVLVLGPGPLWQAGTLIAEFGYNHLINVTKNPQARDPNTTSDATAFRVVFSPQYFQVISGLDITVPIGLGYNLTGNSAVVGSFNGGVHHGGDMSIGINGTYQQVWTFGLNYVHYFGAGGPTLTTSNPQALSFLQSLKDRDFVSLNVKRTF